MFPKEFRNTIECGHIVDVLKTLPEESVQCVVTSPPYLGSRDYEIEPVVWDDGWRGCLGDEPTPELYVRHLAGVFTELKRILRKDGTVWLVLGSSYASSCKKRGRLKSKDLIPTPWLVGLALQADGWYLRSDIIFSKRNTRPESVKDRPSKTHEYVLLLTKHRTYFYDHNAVREPYAPDSVARVDRGRSKVHKWANGGPGDQTIAKDMSQACTNPIGRNLRSVWTITTQPYPKAHFAVFPEKLVEPCIKAGTSEKGSCAKCGSPFKRITKKGKALEEWKRQCGADSTGGYSGQAAKDYASARAEDASKVKARILEGMRETLTVGWEPTCECSVEESVPCVVLDPFIGAGTTAVVAKRLGRDYFGIDAKMDYVIMSWERLEQL